MSGSVSGLTMIANVLVALKFGVPLSVTLTVNRLVLSACDTSGRDAKMPLDGPSVALVGPVNRLNVSVWAGTSGSVATLVTVTMTPTLIVWSETGASVGAVLPTVRVAELLVTEPALFDTMTE